MSTYPLDQYIDGKLFISALHAYFDQTKGSHIRGATALADAYYVREDFRYTVRQPCAISCVECTSNDRKGTSLIDLDLAPAWLGRYWLMECDTCLK